jgi:uncharacterized protein YcnI
LTIRSRGAAALFGLIVAIAPASAHVTLRDRVAVPGTAHKAVFVVPHGCSGSTTVRLAVTIPPGVLLVKPMAKPGWQIDVTRKPYSRPWASSHGAKLTEGVSEVVWSGGRLPDSLYDEFVLATFLSSDLAPGTTIYFPAVQTCETGEHRWVDVPTAGRHVQSGEPAPGLELVRPGARKAEQE